MLLGRRLGIDKSVQMVSPDIRIKVTRHHVDYRRHLFCGKLFDIQTNKIALDPSNLVKVGDVINSLYGDYKT